MLKSLVQLAKPAGEVVLGQGAHKGDLTSGTEVDALYGAAPAESIYSGATPWKATVNSVVSVR